MVRKIHPTSPETIGHGEVALMLCEAILHVFIERGTLTKDDALEALDNVSGILAENDERRADPGIHAPDPLKMIEAMRASLEVK
jgi:hypothetical protein